MSLSKHLRVGFRFQPTEEEIFCHFLRLKMIGKDSEVDPDIAEVDFCNFDPWELPAKSRIKSDDQIWWFFCRQKTGKRTKRATKSGYWKITGKEREIKTRDNEECIGKKKILVFHPSSAPSRGTNWVLHEYHPLVHNPQRPYVICRLEKRTDEKAGAPGCDKGEPNGGDTASEIENPMTPAAISGVHSHGEENADPPVQSHLSPRCYLTLEDTMLIFSNCLSDDQQINSGIHENRPKPEDSFPHQGPYVNGNLENKIDEMGGDMGKPSGDITFDTVTPEVHGHAEENADSPLSLDCGLTKEDIRLIFFDGPSDGQQVISGMHEYHPEPKNSLSHKEPYAISSVKNKTGEKVETPGCYVGEPSGNITSFVEVLGHTEVNAVSISHPFLSPDCHFTEKDKTSGFSNGFNDIQNKMQASCGADDQEAAEFADQLIVYPHENCNGETTNNLSNESIELTSLKRLSSSFDTGVEGVDGRFKRFRSLVSENHSNS